VKAFAVAQWPESDRPSIISPALLAEASECARVCVLVAAVSRAHALRLYLEGTEAVRGVDGRLEAYGVLTGEEK
jgi:hypothetical protein